MINIEDYADIIQADLIIRRYHSQENRYSASFEYSETKTCENSSILESTYGTGKTPQNAVKDYITKITDRILIFRASGGDKRREFGVPSSLTSEAK